MINAELKWCVQHKLYVDLQSGFLCEKGIFQMVCKTTYTGSYVPTGITVLSFK